MTTTFHFRSIQLFSFITAGLFALLLFHACGVTDSDHDHSDAVGFVILQNNAEVFRFENNQAQWNPDGAWDDYYRDGINALVLSPDVVDLTEDNPRGMTPSVFIRWIAPDGDLFELPDLGEEEGGEYWLDWQWEKPNTAGGVACTDNARVDTGVLDQIRPANLEQHGSDGQWGFHFRADHAGEDRIRFRLMHGHGSGAHSDFTSGWINIVVEHTDDHPLIDENGIYHHTRNKCRVDRPRD